MIVAVERFLETNHKGSIGFLITSDEGPFINGTTRVVDTLMERNELIDICIMGPSSTLKLGDVVKMAVRLNYW